MNLINEDIEENPVEPIDLTIFKEHIQQSLLNILDTLPKVEKTLVLENSCISKLNFCTKLDPLKERQVSDSISILKPTIPITNSPLILYIIPAKKEFVEIILAHVIDNYQKTRISLINTSSSKDQNEDIKKEFHIIFIPKITKVCQNCIKNSNFSTFVKTYNLNMDIFALDYDLMSLENYTTFHDLYVEENLNIISVLTRSIIKYESLYGKIKYKYFKGNLAEKLYNTLNREEELSSLDENKNNDPGTFACFMFDRNVDMITPFCTQFVYEGLLDEYFGINFNSIKITPKILEKQTSQDYIKIDLSKFDKFYTQIKDFNFDKIKNFLPSRLREHNKTLEESKQKMDLSKIQENLEKVKQIKEERNSLTNHINIADYISKNQKIPNQKFYLNNERSLLMGYVPNSIYEFIDDEIGKQSEEYKILRFICLFSLLNGGIKNKFYEQIKKDFLNIYGFQEFFLWSNLEKIGILKNSGGLNIFSDLDKKLKLINENINVQEPNDISYSYSGYAPLIIRLIEKALTNGWNSIQDILSKIPGPFKYPNDESEIINESGKKQFILLVFIGGLTYSELGAIRFLSKILKNKKFIILTTNMINYKKIFNSLRQGKYKYMSNDLTNNNGDSTSFQVISEGKMTFKDFSEQINNNK